MVDVAAAGHFSEHPANLWDCYLTQGPSIERLAATLRQTLPLSELHSNLFIYAKRPSGARSFDDPHHLIEPFLAHWAQIHGLEYICFTGEQSLIEQLQLFQRCRVLFGIHGAGFTNLLFTPSDCTIVEIPIHGNCNPLFQELSTLMNRQHLLCKVTCEYQSTLTVTTEVVDAITQTLDQIPDLPQ